MLDAFIIEEIRRRERDSPRDQRPAMDLPVPPPPARPEEPSRPQPPGSVVIIDYSS